MSICMFALHHRDITKVESAIQEQTVQTPSGAQKVFLDMILSVVAEPKEQKFPVPKSSNETLSLCLQALDILVY